MNWEVERAGCGQAKRPEGLNVWAFAVADKHWPLAKPPTDFLRDLGLIARIRGGRGPWSTYGGRAY